MTKQEIRDYIRKCRRDLAVPAADAASVRLAEQLFRTEQYRNAANIFGYLSFGQEVRTLPVLERAQADGKRVAVPKVFGNTMKFLWLDDLTAVAPGAFGIPEPLADCPEADDETALVLMPGLAFDLQGHRCGYGGGFYDRFLSGHRLHPTVALCFDFQLFDHLETDCHDIPADLVLHEPVTED